MNPVQKLWASLKLKWRLTHPVEGIIKPLIKEFWRQTKWASKETVGVVAHAMYAVRSIIWVAFSFPGLLILWGTGLWFWAAGVYSGMSFVKSVLVIYVIYIAQKENTNA